jgi:hypothetical protein
MTALSIQPTFPIFTDIDGQPLEDGYVFIGTANLNPITNPITVYWDAALTLAAAQPIRTLGGYPMNSGTPARLYVNSNYSIQVQNKNGSLIYSAPSATERFSGVVIEVDATDVSFIQAGTGAVTRTAQAKMRDVVSVKDFGAVGNGVADDSAAILAAALATSTSGQALYFPAGTYLGKNLLIYPDTTWFGDGHASVIRLSNSASSGDVLIKNKNCGTNINGSDAAVPGDNNIILQNLAFDGNKTNQTNQNSLIFWRRVQFSRIVGCKFFNSSGLAFDGCNAIDSVVIDGNLFQNNYGNDIRILWVSNRNIITNNTIIGANLPPVDGGESAAVFNDAVVISAFNVTGSVDFNCAENIIANNVIKGKIRGIVLDGAFETVIESNQFGTQTQSAVHTQQTGIYPCQGLTISNNHVTNESTTHAGISLTAKRVQFSSNTVLSSATNCLYVRGDDDNSGLVIDGNTLVFSAVQDTGFCIQYVDGGSVVIANNVLAYGRAGIYFSGPTAGVELWNVTISANDIFRSNRQGIYITDNGVVNRKIRSVSIDGNTISFCSIRSANSDDAILIEQTVGVIEDVHITNNSIFDLDVKTRDAIRFLGTVSRRVVEPNQKVRGINGSIVTGYYTAAPTDGPYYLGQRIYNFAPVSAGTEGWICTASGSPGTWRTFGVIS